LSDRLALRLGPSLATSAQVIPRVASQNPYPARRDLDERKLARLDDPIDIAHGAVELPRKLSLGKHPIIIRQFGDLAHVALLSFRDWSDKTLLRAFCLWP
jgi:hypothetical protein